MTPGGRRSCAIGKQEFGKVRWRLAIQKIRADETCVIINHCYGSRSVLSLRSASTLRGGFSALRFLFAEQVKHWRC
jgi:hypothetical protein